MINASQTKLILSCFFLLYQFRIIQFHFGKGVTVMPQQIVKTEPPLMALTVSLTSISAKGTKTMS